LSYGPISICLGFNFRASTKTHILLVAESATKEALPGALYIRALERSWWQLV